MRFILAISCMVITILSTALALASGFFIGLNVFIGVTGGWNIVLNQAGMVLMTSVYFILSSSIVWATMTGRMKKVLTFGLNS